MMMMLMMATILRITEVPVPQVVEGVVEVPEIIPQKCVQHRLVEQIVDIPVPHIQEEIVEVIAEALQVQIQEVVWHGLKLETQIVAKIVEVPPR